MQYNLGNYIASHSIRQHQILLARYFREELQLRKWGKACLPPRPLGVLLSYSLTLEPVLSWAMFSCLPSKTLLEGPLRSCDEILWATPWRTSFCHKIESDDGHVTGRPRGADRAGKGMQSGAYQQYSEF